jgi:hypothetical protein
MSRTKKRQYKKKHLGGKGATNMVLAYTTDNISALPNPSLAYTGKGGNKIYPSKGPAGDGFNFLNPQVNQRGGGGCGCGMSLNGGGKTRKKRTCSKCSKIFGGAKHRRGCRCSRCKSQKGGNMGIPYPNGLVGSPWTPNAQNWPGVDGIPGDSNHIAYNKYHIDPQTSIIDQNAIPTIRGGGTLSNFMGQDLINFGRQIQYGVGSAYNTLAGYASPINPLPFRDQLTAKLTSQ